MSNDILNPADDPNELAPPAPPVQNDPFKGLPPRFRAALSRAGRMPEAPESIELDDFLKLFPPKKNCRKCFERGYQKVIFQPLDLRGKPVPVDQIRERLYQLKFCPCVHKQYLKSEKFLRVYIEDPETKEQTYLLL